jgi:hypothetical protein
MKIKNKIGWQKYEDLLQNQIDSPFLDSLYNSLTRNTDGEEDDLDLLYQDQDERDEPQGQFLIPVNEKLMENIALATNFNCWMGHTNFNIPQDIKDRLEVTTGVEILKICSRYRFFVGIGKMFDFAEVRKIIEQSLYADATGETGE